MTTFNQGIHDDAVNEYLNILHPGSTDQQAANTYADGIVASDGSPSWSTPQGARTPTARIPSLTTMRPHVAGYFVAARSYAAWIAPIALAGGMPSVDAFATASCSACFTSA